MSTSALRSALPTFLRLGRAIQAHPVHSALSVFTLGLVAAISLFWFWALPPATSSVARVIEPFGKDMRIVLLFAVFVTFGLVCAIGMFRLRQRILAVGLAFGTVATAFVLWAVWSVLALSGVFI